MAAAGEEGWDVRYKEGGESGVGAKTNTLFVIAAVCRFPLTCHMQAVITCFHLRTASSGESGRWHHYSYTPTLCYFNSVRTLLWLKHSV